METKPYPTGWNKKKINQQLTQAHLKARNGRLKWYALNKFGQILLLTTNGGLSGHGTQVRLHCVN